MVKFICHSGSRPTIQYNTMQSNIKKQKRKEKKVSTSVSLCLRISLHFARVVDDAKCIVVARVCVSVYLSAAACLHYCTDPDVTWRSGKGCP